MMPPLLIHLITTCALIIGYYKYTKTALIRLAPTLSRKLGLTRFFPAEDCHGATELALIACSHVCFCILLNWLLHPVWPAWPAWHGTRPLWPGMLRLAGCGILLGIGCMCLSGLLCNLGIQLAQHGGTNSPADLRGWLTTSRGGWIKHHLQSLQLLPLPLSISILALQVGSEEIIFRGILLNFFRPAGEIPTLVIVTCLFVLMQVFLMPNWRSAMFPMVGAAVMGWCHSILYLHAPLLWPLIIAHLSFFLFSVI